MKNDEIFCLACSNGISWGSGIPIFKKSICNRWDSGNAEKYKYLYWWQSICGFGCLEYSFAASFGLFGSFATYIHNIHLDNGIIVSHIERKNKHKKNNRCIHDYYRGNMCINIKVSYGREKDGDKL